MTVSTIGMVSRSSFRQLGFCWFFGGIVRLKRRGGVGDNEWFIVRNLRVGSGTQLSAVFEGVLPARYFSRVFR